MLPRCFVARPRFPSHCLPLPAVPSASPPILFRREITISRKLNLWCFLNERTMLGEKKKRKKGGKKKIIEEKKEITRWKKYNILHPEVEIIKGNFI